MTSFPAEDELPPTGEGPAADPASGPSSREAELEAEVARLKDQALRALAETENTRRRAERDREDTAKFANSAFARELLPVVDNLRRALEAVPPGAVDTDPVLKALLTGVEATERQLLSALEKSGVKPLRPVGESFDPNFHQVMFEVESADQPSGTVVQVMQVGYALHGRLLRPALVGTAKAPSSPPSTTRADA